MRTIGARFDDEQCAQEALAALRERDDLAGAGLMLAPLGSVAGPAEARLLLTGQFADDALPDVVSMIERHGGDLVADRDGD